MENRGSLSQRNKYDKTETHIFPSNMRRGQMALFYYGIPVVEVKGDDGIVCQEIAINQRQLDYCAYEAARILLRDDFARGKINGQVYQLFAQEAEEKIAAVFSGKGLSVDQLEALTWMNRNAQFFNTK